MLLHMSTIEMSYEAWEPIRDLLFRSIIRHFHHMPTIKMSYYMLGNPLRNLGARSIIRHVHQCLRPQVRIMLGNPLRDIKIAILLHFSTIDPHFVRKGCAGTVKLTISHQLLTALISRERVAIGPSRSQLYISFWRSALISCEKVAVGPLKSRFLLNFWRSAIISREKVAIGPSKSQFYISFWRSTFISCEKGCDRTVKIAISPH